MLSVVDRFTQWRGVNLPSWKQYVLVGWYMGSSQLCLVVAHEPIDYFVLLLPAKVHTLSLETSCIL